MGDKVKVYITADNIISALGFGTKENLEAIRNYRTGIRMHTDNRVADLPLRTALVDDNLLTKEVESNRLQAAYTRIEQLAILSIRDVLKQSDTNLTDPRCGFIFASTKGNVDILRHNPHYDKDNVSLWRMAEKVAEYFGRKEDIHVISNACISGVSALILAQRWIESGRYDRVVVTGADVLSHFITSGFLSFKSVSRSVCRPYDADRDGLNLGEGCGTILLSSQGSEGDVILAGGGISNDANHLSGPSRTGDGLFLAIKQAMKEAGLSATDIDMVNAHGTATVYNDEMEAKAIHLAGLEHATINSLKSYFGHTLGAAGVIETIISAHSLKEKMVYGTYGYSKPGVSLPLKVSASHESKPLKACIKTASGFGGCNAAIALSLLPGGNCNEEDKERINTLITSSILIEDNTIRKNGEVIFAGEQNNNLATFIKEAYKSQGGNNLKFYQLSDLCKLGTVGAMYLMDGKSYEPTEAGIIMANANASLFTDTAHQHIVDNSGDMAASPGVFVFTLPNVVTGQICISLKIQGENTFFINKTCNFGELESYARLVMERTGLKYCIIGWCDVLNDSYNAELKLIQASPQPSPEERG